MSRRYYPPASLRYLKARLWNLARPSFWVTAIFLSMVGLVIKEYWQHPDFLTQGQNKQVASNQPANSSVSKQDKAIAADIDNLPVQYNDADQTSLPPTASTPQENTQANNDKGLLNALNSKSQTSASDSKSNPSVDTANSSSAAKLENPFLTQAENLLQVGTSTTDSKLLGVNPSTTFTPQPGVVAQTPTVQPGIAQTYPNSGMGSANQINSQSVAPVSPSQPAFNQSTNQNLPSLNVLPTTIGQNPYVGQSLPTNNSPNQIIPQTPGLSTNPINPASPGTGYAQPALTNPQPNPYSNLNQYSRDNQARYVINQLLNNYTNPGSGQVLTNTVQSSSPIAPPTSTAPAYTTPYYTQTPNQGVVTPSNPPGMSNYSIPGQLPQYNSSSPSQIPGQYTDGSQINGYPHP